MRHKFVAAARRDCQQSDAEAPEYPEPGEVERVLTDAELAVIATGHTDACACEFCIARFAAEVRARWPNAVPRPTDQPPAEGSVRWMRQRADALVAEYTARLNQRHMVPSATQTATPESRDGAAGSTVEALMLELREGGTAALQRPHCRERLGELSTKQIDAVIERLAALRPKYPQITDKLILLLAEARP